VVMHNTAAHTSPEALLASGASSIVECVLPMSLMIGGGPRLR
jgi:hypothetical protein